MTTHVSPTAVDRTKRYLYGLVAANLAVVGLIVAFFTYHEQVQDNAVERILEYHTASTRAAQSGLAQVHQVADLIWHRMDAGTSAISSTRAIGVSRAGSIADLVAALADERETIAALQGRFADPELEATTEAAIGAFDAVLRIPTASDPADNDFAVHLDLLDTLAVRLQQLSRLHMAARDRLADFEHRDGLSNPANLLSVVGFLTGLGLIAGLGVVRNVAAASAERETAFAALRDNESRLAHLAAGHEAAQRIARIGSWEWDIGSDRERWSNQNFRNLGYEPGACETMVTRFYDRVHPHDREKCQAAVHDAVARETGYDIDFRVVWPDGSVRAMREHAEPVFGDDGSLLALHGTMQDITGEHEAEQQAAKLADRLSDAQRIARLGNWEWNAKTKDEWWSDEIYRIFGLAPGSIPASYEAFMDRVHPEDRDRLGAAIQATQSGRAPPYSEIFRIVRPDGSERIVRETGEALFDADGDLLGLTGTTQDVTEQQTAQQKISRLANSLADAQRIARVGNWVWDPDSDLLDWPPQVCEVLGLPPDGGPSSNDAFIGMLHPDDRQPLLDLMRRAVENGEPYSMEFRFVLPDGAVRTIMEHAEPFTPEGSNRIRLRGTIQDITERKKAQEELALTVRRLAESQAAARIGSWERDIETGKEWWSAQQYRNFGLKPGDGLVDAAHFAAFVHPDDRDRMLEAVETAVASATPLDIEFRTVGTDKVERVLWGYGEPEFDDDARPVRMVGTTLDITERKRAEAEIAATARLLADAQRIASIGSWTLDTATGAVRWTDELYRIYGIERRTTPLPTRETFLNYVHADDYQRVLASVEAALGSGGAFDETYRIVRADGEVRILHAHGEWRPDSSGAQRVFTGTTQDITERKKVEDAVRESEARLDAFFVAAPAGLALYDKDGRYVKINETLARDHGVRAEDHIGKRPSDLLPPEFARILEEGNRRTIEAGERVVNQEISAPAANAEDGEIHYVYSRFPIFGPSGKPSGVGVVTVNIAERKKAEQRLAEAVENLNRAQRLASVGSWEWDIVNDRDEWSDECYRIHGLEPGSVEPGGSGYLNYVHPDDRGAVQAAHESALIDRKPLSIEFRVSGADGVERIVQTYGEVTYDGEGRPLRMSGTVQDITERRRREQELRETERKFALAFQISPGMTAISEVDTGIHVDVNDKWVETMGYSREEAIGRTAFELNVWANTDDRARAVSMLRKNGRFRDFEAQYRTRDGELRDFLISAETFPVGDRPHMLIVGHDITERKRAEQAIRESEARLDAFFTTAPAAMAIVDGGYRYVRLNETLALMNGASISEHLGKRPTEFLPADFADSVESVMARTLEHGESIANEEGSARRPDGTIQHWVISQFPIPGAEPGEKALGIVMTDTTEQKKAQEELSRLNAELERRVEERTAELRAAQGELVRNERLATLGRLTATVSHELRNPLGAMRTSLYVIEKKSDQSDERMANAIARVNRSITRCDNIIDELLDFTRIRELQFRDIPVDSWLDALLDEQPRPVGVSVRRDFGAGDPRIQADPDRLRRAVINVFENACQAVAGDLAVEAPKGGHRVVVATRTVGNRLEIIFEDTGPGIAKESFDRIFEPLFSTKNFGVGLGLPVVRQIMEQHGGGVEAGNRNGRGARFVLWLPMERHVEDTEA